LSRQPWSVTCLSPTRRQREFLATQNPGLSVAHEEQKRSVMYEDEDVWPIRCPHCGHGFTAKIRHLKSGVVGKCVSCSNDLGHSTEEFYLALSEARKPVVGLRDAEQRVRLIARRQDRMAKEPALNQPLHSPD
jgi:DNA-directed RNA polymerase subunit RPC12/RpoP